MLGISPKWHREWWDREQHKLAREPFHWALLELLPVVRLSCGTMWMLPDKQKIDMRS